MMNRITGRTRILFILGDPVDHIVGSALLNEFFVSQGVDAAVSPLHVKPGDLAATIAVLRKLGNVAGFGVTIPHKIDVLPHLDEVTQRGRQIGAVNFVRRDPDGRLCGDNVDGLGFVAGLRENGVAVRGMSALQAGAGGAGRAIAFALAEAGVRKLRIGNRSRERAQRLADAVRSAYPDCDVAADSGDAGPFDLVVNATSLGMRESDALPVEAERLGRGCVVAEVVMTPETTPLLAEAARRGCVVVKGKAMLLAQMQAARELVGL